jgi:hypothetical protein
MPEETTKPVLFAVIELFGHARVAGAVSEQNFGGANLIRVDVPEVKFTTTDYDAPRTEGGYPKVTRTIPAHTRSFGAGAIYGINWCDEETARVAAHSIRDEPLQPYSVREALASLPEEHRNRLLPAPGRLGEDEDRPF